MIVLFKLFLAHLIGDFVLQPAQWIRAKEEKKSGAWQLYLHASIHGIITLLLMWNIDFIVWAVVIALSHLFIDIIKISFQNTRNRRMLFFIDQLLHFISLYLIWILYGHTGFSFAFLEDAKIIVLITLLLFLTTPVSFAVRIFISKWTPDTDSADDISSLQSAGTYIGILERLLIFIFMVTNEWQAIGFLLAAKSVFRFGNLHEAHDRKLTEYILIGTLMSFGIAIITGLGYQYLKNMNLV